MHSDDRLLTSREVMEMLRISKDTLHRWMKTKKNFPKRVRMGIHNKWKLSDIEKFIELSIEENKQQ